MTAQPLSLATRHAVHGAATDDATAADGSLLGLSRRSLPSLGLRLSACAIPAPHLRLAVQRPSLDARALQFATLVLAVHHGERGRKGKGKGKGKGRGRPVGE